MIKWIGLIALLSGCAGQAFVDDTCVKYGAESTQCWDATLAYEQQKAANRRAGAIVILTGPKP